MKKLGLWGRVSRANQTWCLGSQMNGEGRESDGVGLKAQKVLDSVAPRIS